MIRNGYNVDLALAYAEKWAFGRNPRYLDFHGIGGDCTNFISQCLYAGAGVMNYTPEVGWFYITSSNRTASWTGVMYLYNFLTANRGAGPYAEETDLSRVELGDVIQLGYDTGFFYHSLFVVGIDGPPTLDSVYIATHTDDAFMRRLSSYTIRRYRVLHIRGARPQNR